MEPNSVHRFPPFSPLLLPPNNRSVNASSGERSLLLGVIASHLNILDARDNDSRTLRHKSLLWDQVTKKFNSLSTLPRSRHQIQTLYKNMKAKAKKYRLRMMEAQMENSPHIFPEPDPVSELLLQLLAGEHEQRRMLLKQTAFNISGDFSSSTTNHDDSQINSSPQEPYITTPPICSIEEDNLDVKVKEEPLSQEQSSIESSLLGDDPLERLPPKAPEGGTFGNFPNISADSSSVVTPRSDTGECDFTPSEFSPCGSNKRPRLSPGSPCDDPPRMVSQFLQDFTEGFNPLKFTESHFPSYSGTNKQCCCPALHTELMAMAKKEHDIRIRIALEERTFRQEQHNEKMKLFELERELCKKKLRMVELATRGGEVESPQHSQDGNDTIRQTLRHLENLCNVDAIIKSPKGDVNSPVDSEPNLESGLETFLDSNQVQNKDYNISRQTEPKYSNCDS